MTKPRDLREHSPQDWAQLSKISLWVATESSPIIRTITTYNSCSKENRWWLNFSWLNQYLFNIPNRKAGLESIGSWEHMWRSQKVQTHGQMFK